jgi:hypothetical protein
MDFSGRGDRREKRFGAPDRDPAAADGAVVGVCGVRFTGWLPEELMVKQRADPNQYLQLSMICYAQEKRMFF